MPNEIELSLLEPVDQVKLVDQWESDRDAYARLMLSQIEFTRREIATEGLGCICCHRSIMTTKQVTHAVALDAQSHVRRAAICSDCTATMSRRELCLVASRSLSDLLMAETAVARGHASIVSNAGNA